ncbi:hypothetical protein RvY_14880 [Ramazzottius varieornatus]|uniref:Uncharacterized protein n=1 Tax=Ramazzottius varieornatus TaxID=947166 RepID=A0A1D1W157_RAMVA|nr:hypothetical protein RvY_14880 [Ramazzottius varieornatus]
MLGIRASLGTDRVDLVDEDGRRCVEASLENKTVLALGNKENNEDFSLTISNKRRTSFSDSPRYLDVSVEEDTLKKVVPHSVATALASIVLPVPGGPTIKTPYKREKHIFCSNVCSNFRPLRWARRTFQGRRMPLKKLGMRSGRTTASRRSLLASVNPAISSLQNNIKKSWNEDFRRAILPTSGRTIGHLDSFAGYPVRYSPPGLYRNRSSRTVVLLPGYYLLLPVNTVTTHTRSIKIKKEGSGLRSDFLCQMSSYPLESLPDFLVFELPVLLQL